MLNTWEIHGAYTECVRLHMWNLRSVRLNRETSETLQTDDFMHDSQSMVLFAKDQNGQKILTEE